MHHNLHLHVVWTTRGRVPDINLARAAYLAEHLPIIVRQERGRVIELGIVSTHLHMLLRFHPTTVLPRLMQRMKGSTAHGINRGSAARAVDLRWAKGYSASTISPRDIDRVADYVRSQPLHHPAEAIPGWEELRSL
jgi:putative transposase